MIYAQRFIYSRNSSLCDHYIELHKRVPYIKVSNERLYRQFTSHRTSVNFDVYISSNGSPNVCIRYFQVEITLTVKENNYKLFKSKISSCIYGKMGAFNSEKKILLNILLQDE